jgi:methyl-accepting chemotaxis protein
MNLSPSEKRWLPLFGKTGKIRMSFSCFLNRESYSVVEAIFDGISDTRVKLLKDWAEQNWLFLSALAEEIAPSMEEGSGDILTDAHLRLPEFSELFVVDRRGEVLASTSLTRIHQPGLPDKVLEEALCAPFLYGPYIDPDTEKLGPTTSRFHDAVTLMFCQPIRWKSQTIAVLCGRMPNDVMSDLIQREAGHIFPESGDNYVFMADSRFDPSLRPGVALSRSRFEDNTFSFGENLKGGVRTRWGTVRVEHHTELELVFNDPATGQLHPGVRETIRKGQNMFVTYPGYSDYRHVPVIGKGVLFQLPGSPDRWGMMCEGDLEEVYRKRTIRFRLLRLFLLVIGVVWGGNLLLEHLPGIPLWKADLLTVPFFLGAIFFFYRFGLRPLSRRISEMTDVIRTLAEGGGNLRQRLDVKLFREDETGEMGKWINSFVDNLDGIVGQVIRTSHLVEETNNTMVARNNAANQASLELGAAIDSMLDSLKLQISMIEGASRSAFDLRSLMKNIMESSRHELETVRERTQGIRQSINHTTSSIESLQKSTGEIGKIVESIQSIADQTNLLALNAAIEAARAGSEGRGFAVVAEEVRKLAERTSSLTEEIRGMIRNVQKEAKDAVQIMENSMSSIQESLSLAEKSSSDPTRIESAVQNMLDTIEKIARTSEAHSRTTKETAKITGEMRFTVRSLENSVEKVRFATGQLKRLAGQFQTTFS